MSLLNIANSGVTEPEFCIAYTVLQLNGDSNESINVSNLIFNIYRPYIDSKVIKDYHI